MPFYTKESLEELRHRINLVEVLAGHVELKKTGGSYKALCPFHDEKTPSFVVYSGDSHYHCFGCGAHGDAIQFLMTYLKMSFNDAVTELAQKFDVSLELLEKTEEYKGPSKIVLKQALKLAAKFYHFQLLHTIEGHEALKYLYSRGLDLDFIRSFLIGFSPKIHMLRKFMHAHHFSDEVLQEAGLIIPGKEGGMRDFFIGRIMFPIQDPIGAVIGFSARKFKEETFGGKYVNTPETSIFKKSRVLFGLNFCRKRIAKERKAIIVEGQLDALRLIKEGFNFTVAGQGTSFGEGHVKELLQLGVKQVYLALDADQAGKEASVKIGDYFQQAGVDVLIIQFPQGMDPDSLLREIGPVGFEKYLEQSVDYLTFLVEHFSRHLNVDSPAGKNELVQSIAARIKTWGNPVMVHESLKKLADLTKVPQNLVDASLGFTPNLYIKKSASIGQQEIDPDRILETDLLRWLLLMSDQCPKLMEIAQKNLSKEDFKVSICKEVYHSFLQAYTENMPRDLLSIAILVKDAQVQGLFSEILQKKVNKEKAQEQFIETARRILERNWLQKREEIKLKIHSGQSSDDEVLELLKRFDELKRQPPKMNI